MATLATATKSNPTPSFYTSDIPHNTPILYVQTTLFHRSLQSYHAGDTTPNPNVMGLGGHLSNPSNIFAAHQSRTLQICAIVFASLSVVASLVTIYWFFLMRRNFRRQLILLLIVGDLFKSAWYLVFASTAIAIGGVKTSSAFCQVNGFLLQTALEACDAAILFISMHMYLQIFSRTSKIFGHDGLYRFRYAVTAIYLVGPLVDASLAFIHDGFGYMSQGPFCTLPIRPFWYRLALTWIPRYLIWLYVMFVALRIYFYVGKGFKVFARHNDRVSSVDAASYSDNQASNLERLTVGKRSTPASLDSEEQLDGATLKVGTDSPLTSSHGSERRQSATNWNSMVRPQSSERRQSATNWTPSFLSPAGPHGCMPLPGSRRGSRVAFQEDQMMSMDPLHVPADHHRTRGSISTLVSLKSNGDISVEGQRPALIEPTLEPIEEVRTDFTTAESNRQSADTPLKKQRRAIQRQLRLLFIYPVVYMIMWAMPFVYHSMNYSDYYAQHPIFGLGLVNIICQCSMGGVDCFVFGWREKPWTRVPGSDGTFLGSFMFWRFNQSSQWYNDEPRRSTDPEAGMPQDGSRRSSQMPGYKRSSSHNSMKPAFAHKKKFAGSSDRTTMAAELAQQRLALERADRERKQTQQQQHSRSASLGTISNSKPTSAEWWDRKLSHTILYRTPSEDTNDFDPHH